MRLALLVACALASPALADGPTQVQFDACLAQLAEDASGAACVVPIRAICLQSVGAGEVAAELGCLNQSLTSVTNWTDALIADNSEIAPLAPQVAEFRSELTRICSGQMTGDSVEDRRDYAMCQLAGASALYRNLRRKDLAR